MSLKKLTGWFKKLNFSPEQTIKSFPTFENLSIYDLRHSTTYSVYNQVSSPFVWTPLLPRIPVSDEFQEFLRSMSKVKEWSHEYSKELTDAFLYEALQNSPFDYKYDHACSPTPSAKFHGVFDFVIYNKEDNDNFGLPFVPVLVVKRLPSALGIMKPYFNPYSAVGAGWWMRNKILALREKNKDKAHLFEENSPFYKIHVMQTDGHAWRLYQFNLRDDFKKTDLFSPRSKENIEENMRIPYSAPPQFYYPAISKVYYDLSYCEVILGMIRYSVNYLTPNHKKVEDAHYYIDRLQDHVEISENRPTKLLDNKKINKYIPPFLRD